jgi:hypothetical protein
VTISRLALAMRSGDPKCDSGREIAEQINIKGNRKKKKKRDQSQIMGTKLNKKAYQNKKSNLSPYSRMSMSASASTAGRSSRIGTCCYRAGGSARRGRPRGKRRKMASTL